MNIIEELYFGNIELNGKAVKNNEKFDADVMTIDKNELELMQLLSGKEEQLFRDYSVAYACVNGQTAVENFIMGFRLGAKFCADVMGCDFKDYMKDK